MGNQLKLVSNTRIYLDARALLDEILDIDQLCCSRHGTQQGQEHRGGKTRRLLHQLILGFAQAVQ